MLQLGLDQEPRNGSRGSTRILLSLALVLVLTAVVGYQQYQSSRRVEQQVALMQEQVRASSQKAHEAAEMSRSAQAEAARAEQNARVAALGRMQAEEAGAQAAQQAEQSRQVAEAATAEAQAATAEAQAARREADQLRQRREAELDRLQKTLGKIVGDTERTPLGLVMTLGSDSVKFDFDKATLRPEDRELLSRIAGVLLTTYGFRIQIFGYTDDIGSEEYNRTLSERRAKTVRDYLVDAGVSPEGMTTKGFGKSSPRVDGDSPSARAKNRRVEIGIIDSVIGFQGEVAQKTPNQ